MAVRSALCFLFLYAFFFTFSKCIENPEISMNINAKSKAYRPVVLWHGMGDTCCNPLSLGRIRKLIENELPGIYVYSIEVGNSEYEDKINGFLMNVNDQLSFVDNILSRDINLIGGFNAIGFSQGSQFLRGYVQRYNRPPVYNLVSIGGQHQGVFGFPKCPGENYTLCEVVRKMLNLGVYVDVVQNNLVQAEYWQDPFNIDEYRKKSVFLADINNDLVRNETYKQNLISLNKFVMIKFTKDSMVQPLESSWFGFYKEGQDKVVLPMQETALYNEDWIGLKTLNGKDKLAFLSVDDDHLRFSDDWFISNIIWPYLNNSISEEVLVH
jgi:palmitoyl-protein thioesterase